jgi:hypothetical protein
LLVVEQGIPLQNGQIPFQESRESGPSASHQLHNELSFNQVSAELQKQLVNAITKSDWPRFSGQGGYDHMDFVHWIDTAKRDSHVPDKVVILKLLTILEGVALSWYKTIHMTVHTNDWAFWREAICKKFGTTNWKRKKQYAFEKDKFLPGETPVAEWVTRQYKRLQAFDPLGLQESVNFWLLGLMSGEVEYAAKNALPSLDADLSSLISVLEDIVDKTRLHQNRPQMVIPPLPNVKVEVDKPRKPLSEVECFICKKLGHTSRNSKKAVRAVSEEQPLEDTVSDSPAEDNGLVIGEESLGTMSIAANRGRNNLVWMKCCTKDCVVL